MPILPQLHFAMPSIIGGLFLAHAWDGALLVLKTPFLEHFQVLVCSGPARWGDWRVRSQAPILTVPSVAMLVLTQSWFLKWLDAAG